MSRPWDWEITPRTANFSWNLTQLMDYRHLLWSLVRKEFLLSYQQTILGPLWMLAQPLLTLLTYTLVFGKLIGIPTGNGIPPVLFYLSGIILWNFFNESFTSTSRTFRENASVFSKVYFPRIIVPLAVLCTQFIRFLVQMLLFVVVCSWMVRHNGVDVASPSRWPFIILSVVGAGLAGLGAGTLVSVITAKYRDLVNIIDVCVRLLFFVTPVVYPVSVLRPDMRWVIYINPLTPLFEIYRYGIFETAPAAQGSLLYALLVIIVLLLTGLWLFNVMGNKLIDVI